MPDITASLSLLRQAIRVNPRLQIALGVAGIGGVVSIVLSLLGGDRELAVLGGLFVVGFMFLLSVYTTITDNTGTIQRPYLSTFLIWSISTVFVFSLSFVVSSYFFCWPQPFGRSCEIGTKFGIRSIDFVSEANAERKVEGNDKYYVIPSIARRPSRDQFYLRHVDGAVFFIAIIVDGFKVENKSIIVDGVKKEINSIDVAAEVITSTDKKGLVNLRSTGSYEEPESWKKRHIPKNIDPNKLPKQLRDAGFDFHDRMLPIIVALGCLRDADVDKEVTFLVTVFDNKSQRFEKRDIKAIISKDNALATLMPLAPPEDCTS